MPKFSDADMDCYPFSIASIRNSSQVKFHPDVTFLVGENGSGKSTLLEAIAALLGFSPEGGTVNVNLDSADDRSILHEHLKASRSVIRPRESYFLRAESFFNVATADNYFNLGKLHQQSHGEAFLDVLTNRLNGDGIYLFDEPEAALSPVRQLAAVQRIHSLVEKDSQFIIATHSPILMAYPRARILQFDEFGINEISYTETEHYKFTKNFLNNHGAMMHHLLKT
ncbi:MAG: AAA family ATPase [Kofleriaceae bacterium]|nr:AAA family ATPase [Kofleriaceae bacterium]